MRFDSKAYDELFPRQEQPIVQEVPPEDKMVQEEPKEEPEVQEPLEEEVQPNGE